MIRIDAGQHRSADFSDSDGGSAALKRSDPTSPVRQRPRSVALSADLLPGNSPDWRYQAQQGGVLVGEHAVVDAGVVPEPRRNSAP